MPYLSAIGSGEVGAGENNRSRNLEAGPPEFPAIAWHRSALVAREIAWHLFMTRLNHLAPNQQHQQNSTNNNTPAPREGRRGPAVNRLALRMPRKMPVLDRLTGSSRLFLLGADGHSDF